MSWLRRAALSAFLGVLAATGFYLALASLSFIPGFKGWYEELATHLSFFPDDAKKLPWGSWMIFGVAVAAAIRISATAALKSLDFHLFSKLDDETLEPISPHTGMFVWHMPDGSEQHTAWNALLTWMGVSGREARWSPAWLFGGPKRKSAFTWTILLGRNGTGKSQLARELGRHLARSGPHEWWRRVAWWRTADDIPWDAGLVARNPERLARLNEWLPRAPTLLILDDPPLGRCEAVISTLARNESKFWYPVRLLIVDQFVPPDLPIVKNSDREGWHQRDSVDTAFSPVVLPAVAFEPKRFRATLGGGFWVARRDTEGVERLVLDPSVIIPSLVRDQDFERIVRALEGDPLLLGLATHWLLRTGASLADLLRGEPKLVEQEAQLFVESSAKLRKSISHRIVSDRVEELYESLKRVESPAGASALRTSIACATIASGITPSAAARAFGLRLGQTDMHRIFPRSSGAIDEIPPISPWALGESFVLKVERDLLSAEAETKQGLSGVIDEAWRLNPEGTLRCLSRSGQLACRVSQGLRGGTQATGGRLRSFLALAQRALFVSRDTLDLVSSIASQLDAPDAENALVSIDRMVATSRPHPESACVLYCCLMARKIAESPLAVVALPEVLESLQVLLARAGAPDSVQESLRALADSLIRAITLWPEPDAVDGLLQIHAAIDLPQILASACSYCAVRSERSARLLGAFERLWTLASRDKLTVEQDETLAHEIEATVVELDLPAVSGALISAMAWRSVAEAQLQARDAELGMEAAVRRVDMIAQQHPEDARIQCQRIAAWRCQIRSLGRAKEHGAVGGSIDGIVTQIEQLAEHFPQVATVQRERIEAWLSVALIRFELVELQALVVGAARHIDALARRFPRDRVIQLDRALAWSILVRWQGPTHGAVEAIDSITSMFEDDPSHQRLRIAAWTESTKRVWGKPDEILSIARRVEEISMPFDADRTVQQMRSMMWRFVAEAYADLPGHSRFVELIAQQIEQLVQAYTGDPGFQCARVGVWSCVVQAHSADARDRGDCNVEDALRIEAAVRRVDDLAARFGSDEGIQLSRAQAWSSVAVARSLATEEGPRAEVAARHVEDIAGNCADGRGFRFAMASAWRAVVKASVRIQDGRGAEAAASRMDTIAEPFPEDLDIQYVRANAWSDVAGVRSREAGGLPLAQAAALIVDAIGARFSDEKALQRPRVRAWGYVARARSSVPEEQASTQEAAQLVDAYAVRFPNDEFMNSDRAYAWHAVVDAWSSLGEDARATAAAERCLEILESIATPSDDLVSLRISLLSRLHPNPPPAATHAPHHLSLAKAPISSSP